MTLRRKIVALTLCLLLLFAMTAAASILLQSKISEQFSGVVDDYLPLNAAIATVDVFTDRYELDLRRLAADLRDGGTGAAAIAQQGEAERLREAGVLTTTFQKAEALLDQVVQDQSESAEKRVAMADIRGRFGYMKRALSRAPSTELGNLATNAAMPIGLRPSAKGPDAHPVSIQGTGQVWVNVQKMTRRKSGNSAFGAGLLPKRTRRAAR